MYSTGTHFNDCDWRSIIYNPSNRAAPTCPRALDRSPADVFRQMSREAVRHQIVIRPGPALHFSQVDPFASTMWHDVKKSKCMCIIYIYNTYIFLYDMWTIFIYTYIKIYVYLYIALKKNCQPGHPTAISVPSRCWLADGCIQSESEKMFPPKRLADNSKVVAGQN